MGNCFAKTVRHEIVHITWGTIDRPPSWGCLRPAWTSPKPPLPNLLPACEVVWPVLDVRSLYILERELSSGPYGTVYLCTERATGLRFACRSASKLRRADVQYMRREVTVLQRLGWHPNVAGFRAAFEDADSVHLVAELCTGGGLLDRVIAGGSYSERHAAAACRDVLTVVHVCHTMGIMHRDIKLENFLLGSVAEDAPLKAIGFGHSVFIEQGKVYKEIVGSPYYVAPEVLQRNYGREIDVWSAGVILYILLCGSAPFWAETEKGIFDAILVGQVDLCSSPWPTISESAKDLIRQMLNKDPRNRITAVQALEHPWLKEGGASDTERPIDSATLSRMKQFKATKELKPLDPKANPENLSPEEIEGKKQKPSNMETDKSEKITNEELKIGSTSKNSEAEVPKLTKEADVDNSDIIDNTGPLPAMMNKDKPEKEEDLLPAVQDFDKDKNGHGEIGEKDASEIIKRSKSSSGKTDKKEEDQEFNKPENDSVVVEEMPSSQVELDKKANGEKDASEVIKRSKSSSRENDKKEEEQELNEPENDSVVMEEMPSSQVELDKKLEEELRKKTLADENAGGSALSNTQEMGVDRGVGNTESQVNNYEYQDENHVLIEDTTDDKLGSDVIARKLGDSTEKIQEMNHDTETDTDESISGTSTIGEEIEEVNSAEGIAETDTENSEEIRREKGRTEPNQKMMDNAMERIKPKNMETVPVSIVRKNNTKEEEKEQHKAKKNNVETEELPSSPAELTKPLIEDSSKKMSEPKLVDGSSLNINGNNEQHVQDNNNEDMDVDGRVVDTIGELKNHECQDESKMEMEDITNAKIDSDNFAGKLGYDSQQVLEMKRDGHTDTDESTGGTLVSGEDKEEDNSGQGTIGTDKENFVKIGRRKSWGTNTNQKMMDNGVERVTTENLETVPVMTSSQAELDKNLEEELKKKMLAQKLAGRGG